MRPRNKRTVENAQRRGAEPVPQHVEQTVASVLEIHRRAEERLNAHQRFIERLTRALGRPRTVALILGVALAWVVANLALGRSAYDPPPFPGLSCFLSLASVLLTTIVLTTENRLGQLEERRAQLHLQLTTLTEAKVAKAIELIEALRRDHPEIPDRPDPEARAMVKTADPAKVLDLIEERNEAAQQNN